MIETIGALLGAATVGLIAAWMLEIVAHYRANRPCEHEYTMSQYSNNEVICYDCGAHLPLDTPNNIKHQR